MWKFIKTGTEVGCELFGVNIFEREWENTGEKAKVLDPLYNETHIFTIYNANVENNIVTFVAGEFSNGVYGFYVKE